MKFMSLFALTVSLLVPVAVFAQDPDRPPRDGEGRGREGRFPDAREGERGPRGRFPNPILEALDADKDGELSAAEIENAAVALKTLDKNQDGKLEGNEIRPNFEAMRGQLGFPDGAPPAGEGLMARLMAMDADKDSKLSKDEMPERLQSMFARGDKNEDGFLDKEELLAAMRERMGEGRGGFGGFMDRGQGDRGGDFAGQMFSRADKDQDGRLTGDEIPPFLRDRLERLDTNKDNALDKAELAEMAKRMGQGRGEGKGRGEGRERSSDENEKNKSDE